MDAFWSQVRSKFDFRHLFPAEDEESVRWSESCAKGRQRGQKEGKGNERSPKWSQGESGCQKGAKGNQNKTKGNQNDTKL